MSATDHREAAAIVWEFLESQRGNGDNTPDTKRDSGRISTVEQVVALQTAENEQTAPVEEPVPYQNRPSDKIRPTVIVAIFVLIVLIISSIYLVSHDNRPDLETAQHPAAVQQTSPAAVAGKKTYEKICVLCHGIGVAGAPKLDDKMSWEPRIAKGVDALLHSAIYGVAAMPPRGSCSSCTDADLKEAIEYMISQPKLDTKPTRDTETTKSSSGSGVMESGYGQSAATRTTDKAYGEKARSPFTNDAMISQTASEPECDPNTPYIFQYPAAKRELRLTRCTVDSSGAPVAREAPEPSHALVEFVLIELVQRHLVDLGFDIGKPDGKLGKKTVNAIRQFQAKQNLKKDGKITFLLLDRLQHPQ